MKIVLGSDHAGFEYKEAVKAELRALGHEVIDVGTHSLEPVDYPDFIRPAAQMVQNGLADAGVIFGGSGNGEAMAANRLRGVRAAVAWDLDSARLGKEHNNANVLSLGQRMVPRDRWLPVLHAWLDAKFQGGRHLARLEKLDL